MKAENGSTSTQVKAPQRESWRKWSPKLANLLLWLLFCSMTATGLLLAYRLPPGSRGGHGLSLLGWTRHDWGDLHLWISYGFLALILAHLALHWRWFWQIAGKRRAWPILVGIGAGIALVITSFCLPVKRTPEEENRPHAAGDGMRFRGGRP